MLADRECEITSIGGDCRAAKNSRFLTAPQLGAGSVGELPDALAGAGRGDIQKIVRAQPRGESRAGRERDWSRGRQLSWVNQRSASARVFVFGLASVTTRRRPSALAASEVYRSRPEVSRWGMRRSTSML